MTDPTSSPRRILVVDDNLEIHEDYRKILVSERSTSDLNALEAELFGTEAATGQNASEEQPFRVDSAMQGSEALERVKAALERGEPYALAFVDMRMPPGWDGLETIEHLWAVDPRLQVVICSAYSDHSRDEIIARTGGGDRLVILRKPFDPAEVAQLADAMTAKWEATRQAELHAADLEARVEQRTGELAHANAALQDKIKELESARHDLALSEERYAVAAAGANDGLWDWDLLAGRMHGSARWHGLLGRPAHDAEVSPDVWLDAVHPEDRGRVDAAIDAHLTGRTTHFETEHRLTLPDDAIRWVRCRGMATQDADGRRIRMAGSLSDIDQRKQYEFELREGAYYDRLTSLPNRSLFIQCLDAAIATSENDDGLLPTFAVLFLDFDDFKLVNDSLGHSAGDRLLITAAERLAITVSQTHGGHHTVARLGGDEFVVLLQRGPDGLDPEAVAEMIHRTMAEPIDVGQTKIETAVSIGITHGDGAHASADDVLRDADVAMYAAKSRGSGGTAVFDASMRERAVARLRIETALRHAVREDRIELEYQPIVDSGSGVVVALEALARWNHEELGRISPGRFIPVAERTGLIQPMGEVILHRALADLARLRGRPGLAGLAMNVNLSPRQFDRRGFVDLVRDAVESAGLPPEALRLEITESLVMEDLASATAILRSLRDIGVEVHLDDFGTGYSSLSCLKTLPLNGIKLDRSFVRELHDGPVTASAIVHAVVTLASHLGLTVVAEGIETADQLAWALALGVDSSQGFLFSPARPIEDILPLLERPIVLPGLDERRARAA